MAAAPLRVIELRPAAVHGLRHAPARRWREALLSAGLLAEVEPSDDPDDPRGWMLAVQGLLTELVALEERRDGLVWIDDRSLLHDAPWWLWLGLLFQPWLAVELGRRQPDDADKLITVGLIYGVPGAIAVGIGLTIAVVIRRRRTRRRAALTEVKQRIDAVRADLADGAARTLARDFVARAGERLLVCTPSLPRAAGPEAEALSDRVAALTRDPPDGWVDLVAEAAPAAG